MSLLPTHGVGTVYRSSSEGGTPFLSLDRLTVKSVVWSVLTPLFFETSSVGLFRGGSWILLVRGVDTDQVG